mmetsp:Transcript_26029/g.63564  ORF Transcript_26029/g.63564 Transcript_26029/m.63564 type:complete len:525 (-) Transcript_26029:410-1984(-)|eukprot:CAMPEP_0113621968 /NCGR_PEP_ID=MMETSP0017_2-20120614/11245_1 /TAXON_ID=2856 /ORGANISM="Cylindrotheca closterium" /LENGTH=524 /DNA_ID=CAMNT_0000531763 /DNA_START=117 /DNA_END=1691 /DNA_ORIENTATION=+ /assembly_acc=CAM_ASM_000147
MEESKQADTKSDNETKSPPSTNKLDETWFYYQNPTSGSVSTAPMTLRQLSRLFCPVREGLKPILPPQTRCLQVLQGEQFGDWKLASECDVLREASAEWYLTGKSSGSEGPFSCRKILEEKPRMVYASGVTDKWSSVNDIPNLKLVLEALENATSAMPESNVDQPAESKEVNPQQVQDELESFLSATAEETKASGGPKDSDPHGHVYESDGGTQYIKDPLTGNWVHEALVPEEAKKEVTAPKAATTKAKSGSKKQKKSKFSKRNAKNWIYITGLPTDKDVTEDDIHKFFSRAGLLDLDPESLKPKIKLYRAAGGQLKGDASVCYAKADSVNLALQVLDESPWDEKHIIRVQKAKFEAKTTGDGSNTGVKRRRPASDAKRKVARLALLQAQDEGFGSRLSGGRKGLCIVVVKNMMEGIEESKLEDTIYSHCQEHGEVEKITCMEKAKVVVIKFAQPTAAANALGAWNGKSNPSTQKKMEAVYWDGVTDYTHKDDESDEEERHDQFGKWLESQEELPEELRLKVADH